MVFALLSNPMPFKVITKNLKQILCYDNTIKTSKTAVFKLHKRNESINMKITQWDNYIIRLL